MNIETKNRAFTLIELLVVIAIIALLASIVLVALNGARVSARDAKRVGDLNQLVTALNLYYSDYGTFPAVYTCDSTAGSGNCWATLLSSSYIGQMPVDPLNQSGSYAYLYTAGNKPNGNCAYQTTLSTNDYFLATRLEKASDSPNSCSGNVTLFDGYSNLNYIVGQ